MRSRGGYCRGPLQRPKGEMKKVDARALRRLAAASPHAVPVQFTDESAADPEEAYVAAIAICHMLSFLPLAALARFGVLRYEDEAVGRVEKNERGVCWVSEV